MKMETCWVGRKLLSSSVTTKELNHGGDEVLGMGDDAVVEKIEEVDMQKAEAVDANNPSGVIIEEMVENDLFEITKESLIP